MRKLYILLLINVLPFSAFAGDPPEPVVIFDNQVIVTSTQLIRDDLVGEVAIVTGGDIFFHLSVDSELNDHPNNLRFFSQSNDNSLGIAAAVNLNQVFWEEDPPGFKDILLTVTVRNLVTGGVGTNTVTIRVTAGGIPTIEPGQSRTVASDTDPGQIIQQGLAVDNPFVSSWSLISQKNWPDGGTPIPGVSQDEVFFGIDNVGVLAVVKDLTPFFGEVLRAGQVAVTLEVVAYAITGGSQPETVTVFITEAIGPVVYPGQTRSTDVLLTPGQEVGAPLFASGVLEAWTITGLPGDPDNGNYQGAFNILSTGTLIAARYFDTVDWPAPAEDGLPSVVTLHVAAADALGFSDPTPVTVYVNHYDSGRCGRISDGQIRFVSSAASPSDLVGFPLDTHNLDSIWIDEAFIDGELPLPDGSENPPDVETAFGIEDPDPASNNFAQLRVVRPMRDYILVDGAGNELITKVNLRIRGHVSQADQPGCPEYVENWVPVYILPADAGETGDPDDPDPDSNPDTTDLTSFIDDPALVQCIQASLGLFGSQPITATLALELTHLDCLCVSTQSRPGAIANLSGIQLFPNLEFLNLSNNLISDIRALSGLTKLTDLRLSGNLISDIETSSPLASLVALENLDLSHNQIIGGNAFSTLANIEFLNLSNNFICDIGSLVALTNLGAELGINQGDTIILDHNRLSSIQAQQDIGDLEAAGAFVTHTNDPSCGVNANIILLQQWPQDDMLKFTDFINQRLGETNIPPCPPVPTPAR